MRRVGHLFELVLSRTKVRNPEGSVHLLCELGTLSRLTASLCQCHPEVAAPTGRVERAHPVFRSSCPATGAPEDGAARLVALSALTGLSLWTLDSAGYYEAIVTNVNYV